MLDRGSPAVRRRAPTAAHRRRLRRHHRLRHLRCRPDVRRGHPARGARLPRHAGRPARTRTSAAARPVTAAATPSTAAPARCPTPAAARAPDSAATSTSACRPPARRWASTAARPATVAATPWDRARAAGAAAAAARRAPSVCGTPPCMATKTCAPFLTRPPPAARSATAAAGAPQLRRPVRPQTCGGGRPRASAASPAPCTNSWACQQVNGSNRYRVTTTVTGTVFAPNGTDPLPNVLVYVPNAPVQAFGRTGDRGLRQLQLQPSRCSLLVERRHGHPGQVHASPTCRSAPTSPPASSADRDRRRLGQRSRAWPPASLPVPGHSGCASPRTSAEGDIPTWPSPPAPSTAPGSIGVDATSASTTPSSRKLDRDRPHPPLRGDGTVNVPGEGTFHLAGATGGTGTASETTLVQTPAHAGARHGPLSAVQAVAYRTAAESDQRRSSYANAGRPHLRPRATSATCGSTTGRPSAGRPQAGTSTTCDLFDLPDGASSTRAYPPDQTGIRSTPPRPRQGPGALAVAPVHRGLTTARQRSRLRVNTCADSTGRVQNVLSSAVRGYEDATTASIGTVPMHVHLQHAASGRPPPTSAGASPERLRMENHRHTSTRAAAYARPGLRSRLRVRPTTPMTPAGEARKRFMILPTWACVRDGPTVPALDRRQDHLRGPEHPVRPRRRRLRRPPPVRHLHGARDLRRRRHGQPVRHHHLHPQDLRPAEHPSGPAKHGCGALLQCGSCSGTRGGGGKPGVCGAGTCPPPPAPPRTSSAAPPATAAATSSPAALAPPASPRGGGGVTGQCGTACTPKTCAQLGYNCGPAGDGCGGELNCGTCTAPATCGGGGTPNVCGGGVVGDRGASGRR